jgi:hypothetical protein
MSLFIAGKSTPAAFNPKLSVNLLTRSHASQEHVSRATSNAVQLPVAIHFLGQEACMVLPFTVTEDNIRFDVLGTHWQYWCSENKDVCKVCVFGPPDYAGLFSALSVTSP